MSECQFPHCDCDAVWEEATGVVCPRDLPPPDDEDAA